MKILLDNALGHIAITRMLPYWKKNHHNITTNANDKPNIQLSFVRFGIHTNLPKILRLDGIYYDSATDYNNRNLAISNGHQIADGIIYQSIHSSMMCGKYLGKKKNLVSTKIIYNGIDPNWCGSPIEHDGINIAVANKWRRHKRLKETIELFIEFLKIKPNSMLHIFGRLHDNIEIKHPKIKYYGQVEREKLIDIYRKTDFTLHLSKRDSCPNSVVEYIGAGIPVITTNNCGGATEMCKLTEGCIIIDNDGDYNNLDPVSHYQESWNILPKNVKNDILDAMILLANEKRRVQIPKELTAECMANEYIKYMEDVI